MVLKNNIKTPIHLQNKEQAIAGAKESIKKFYAIRCSTEEQARECEKYGYYSWDPLPKKSIIPKMLYMQVISGNHTIVTYEEAQSLGLLGEKNEEPYYCDWRCPECGNTNTHKVCSKCGYKIFNL